MKLIIQIPCFNEALHLPATLDGLPREVDGFDVVEFLVIDDGSTDDTAGVARAHGAHHVVRHKQNRGLARAFETGMNTALELGADVIVNTDADNQYCADDIPKLTAPILSGEGDIVVGSRPIDSIEHFSPLKKLLQRLGSSVVRWVSRTNIPDAASGFRALSKSAAIQLHVFSDFTYTLETIIQAGQKGIAITSVPVRINGPTRASRLSKGMFDYVRRSIVTIVRIFITYRPLRFFMFVSAVFAAPGVFLGLRFLYYYASGGGGGKVQSLILAALLIGIAFLMLMVGLLADLISVNRKLLERTHAQLHEIKDTLGRSRPGPG